MSNSKIKFFKTYEIPPRIVCKHRDGMTCYDTYICALRDDDCKYYDDEYCDVCSDYVAVEEYPWVSGSDLIKIIELISKQGYDFGMSYSKKHKKYFASKELWNEEDYLSCLEDNMEDAILELACSMVDLIRDEVRNIWSYRL